MRALYVRVSSASNIASHTAFRAVNTSIFQTRNTALPCSSKKPRPAGEIREVRPKRQLSHKLETIEPAAAQFLKQATFGFGVIAAECAGAGAGRVRLKSHEAETDERNDSVAELVEPKGPHPPFGHPLG